MTRSKRLQPLVRVAARREEVAASALAQSRRLVLELESRLEELGAYREEYERQWQDAGIDGVSAERLKECRVFLERLNDAIREARDRLLVARHHTTERRGEWLSQRSRYRALEELVERARAAERLGVARREQREADDRSQRGPGDGPT